MLSDPKDYIMRSLIMKDSFIETMKFREKMKNWIEAPKYAVLNPQRAALLYMTQQKIQDILNEEGVAATVEVLPDPLETGDAILSIEADSFSVGDVTGLFDVLFWAQNFEIYPLENEKICFSAVFPNIADVHLMDSPVQ